MGAPPIFSSTASVTVMKALWCHLVLAASLLLCSCTPPAIVQQKPVPTPHPARGAAEQAVYLYPDLGVPDSHFRRTFDEIYEDQRLNNPKALTKVDWPLTLARRTAAMLDVGVARPVAEATPMPSPRREPIRLSAAHTINVGLSRGLPMFVARRTIRISIRRCVRLEHGPDKDSDVCGESPNQRWGDEIDASATCAESVAQ